MNRSVNFDEKTGCWYYFNHRTGQSQWERPAEIIELQRENAQKISKASDNS